MNRSVGHRNAHVLEAIVDDHHNDEWGGGSHYTSRFGANEIARKAFECGRSSVGKSNDLLMLILLFVCGWAAGFCVALRLFA